MAETQAREGDIVIVGGYGHVGLNLARQLAPVYPGRVVLAGRSQTRADRAAAEIGYGSRGLWLDSAAGLAPSGAGTVIMCLDQFDPSFASDCLSSGMGYLEISADGRILDMVEALDPTAKRKGGAGLLDVGFAPGLSNLMARLLVESVEEVRQLDILVLLGVGDDHGTAALEWTLDKFDSEFIAYEDGLPQWFRAQRETRTVEVPGHRWPLMGVRFDFPEQRSLFRTLGVPTVSSWMVTMPPSVARSMRIAALAGGGELTRRPRSRKALLAMLERGSSGTDECGVMVQAADRDGRVSELAVIANDQSRLTGIATALFAAELIEGRVPAGVHHSDQVIDPRRLLGRLAAENPEIRILSTGANTITL
ncbi:MAG: hypothetical protein KDB52_10840 [Solirubrobacterales bacterium]|nr:hypothetical protein [Solirubrobacterales bacterium]